MWRGGGVTQLGVIPNFGSFPYPLLILVTTATSGVSVVFSSHCTFLQDYVNENITLTDWLTEWQGHIMSCPVQRKSKLQIMFKRQGKVLQVISGWYCALDSYWISRGFVNFSDGTSCSAKTFLLTFGTSLVNQILMKPQKVSFLLTLLQLQQPFIIRLKVKVIAHLDSGESIKILSVTG